eukprot:3978020-Pyramimonas_sp.AAC.3
MIHNRPTVDVLLILANLGALAQPTVEVVVVLASVVVLHKHLLVELGAGGLDHLGALLGNLLCLGRLALLLRQQLHAGGGLGVGVELEHGTQVLEGVLLERLARAGSLGGVDNALDLIGVDDAVQVRVGHDVARHGVTLLGVRLGSGRAVDGVQLLRRGLGPHNEAAHVATGGQLEQVQAVHGAHLHTGDVAESLGHTRVAAVDHQGTTALDVAPVPHLTLTGTDVAGILHALNVSHGTDLLEQLLSLGGLGDALGGVGDNQGELGDTLDGVTTGHHQGGHRRSSESGAHGIALLVDVDLTVPPAP